MNRFTHHVVGVFLAMMICAGNSADAQEPTLSLSVVSINGYRITNSSFSNISVSSGDRIDIEAYIRDWSVSGQQLAGYQVEIDPKSFTSGALGVIEPIGLQESVEKDAPDLKSSFVDRQHPRFIYKGLQSLDVTKSFGKGYRVAGVVVGDQGPISSQDGVSYYAGTMSFVVSDNAAGRFVLIPADDSRRSVLVDHATVSIVPLHCEPIVIDVCDSVKATTLTRFIDSLLAADGMTDIKLPCTAIVASGQSRVNLGLSALNATLFSMDHPIAPDEELLTGNEGSSN